VYRKLKASEIAEVREKLLIDQRGCCALCKLPVKLGEDDVLDHDHGSGAIRATLHRGCNALLGKIENNHKRYGVKNLAAFLTNAMAYLQAHETNRTGLLHPTHKTDDEKRVARNKRARLKRAAKKEKA
jgi:hypothetical protein